MLFLLNSVSIGRLWFCQLHMFEERSDRSIENWKTYATVWPDWRLSLSWRRTVISIFIRYHEISEIFMFHKSVYSKSNLESFRDDSPLRSTTHSRSNSEFWVQKFEIQTSLDVHHNMSYILIHIKCCIIKSVYWLFSNKVCYSSMLVTFCGT